MAPTVASSAFDAERCGFVPFLALTSYLCYVSRRFSTSLLSFLCDIESSSGGGILQRTRVVSVRVIFALTCALFVRLDAYAQIGGGALLGEVLDASGRPLPGATLELREATGRARTAVTGQNGTFVFPGLSTGIYRLRATLDGFRRLDRQGIRLATGETIRVDLELAVGDVQETILVTADAPLLRSETGSLGQVVTQEKIQGLPLNGRSFISLAGLAPGVALPPGSSLPRINGGRPRTNEYLFDGISVLQPEPGQVAFFPVVDAIQEFKIESNSPAAEFGRFNGGVVNLTTKAGTNQLRGTVFEFFRNEALNARNFFAASRTKPEFRRGAGRSRPT